MKLIEKESVEISFKNLLIKCQNNYMYCVNHKFITFLNFQIDSFSNGIIKQHDLFYNPVYIFVIKQQKRNKRMNLFRK